MTDTLTMIEASMRADADALRVISQNVANAEVVAYRRQVPVQAGGFDAAVDAVSVAMDGLALPVTETAVDTRAGTLKTTGQPLDLAIEGAGFFVLQGAAGPMFTRRGDFHVSAAGVLTAASGESVLGTGGPIQLGTALPTIDSDGTVRIGTDIVDRLQLVRFADEAQLQYLGNGSYLDAGAARATDDSSALVRQGFVEAANVAPVTEMVQLMETMRHFEAAQRVARGFDQMMEKAISELGKTGG